MTRRTGLVWRDRAVLPLAVLGSALLLHGSWIPAKAWLAQLLIARAWSTAGPNDPTPRPWPWADSWPVARLHPPGKSRPLFVLAGASGEALAFGPGHVSSSAPPGGGDNVAIAGHRDTHFAFLRTLEPGDALTLESREGSVRYVVASAEVVHETELGVIERTGRSELTLITCYPFDTVVPGGPLRYVVHARARPEGGSSR